jgi:hypothetical protein
MLCRGERVLAGGKHDARRDDEAGALARNPPPVSVNHFVAVADRRDAHRLQEAELANARDERVHELIAHRGPRRMRRLVDKRERELAVFTLQARDAHRVTLAGALGISIGSIGARRSINVGKRTSSVPAGVSSTTTGNPGLHCKCSSKATGSVNCVECPFRTSRRRYFIASHLHPGGVTPYRRRRPYALCGTNYLASTRTFPHGTLLSLKCF